MTNLVFIVTIFREKRIYTVNFQANLHCLPNSPDTVGVEPELIKKGTNGFSVFRDYVRNYAINNFDYTLIDCPPNHGIFVINALFASDFAIVPTEINSKDSFRGLQRALYFIEDIKKGGNPDLKFLKLLVTKVDYYHKILLDFYNLA